MMIHRCTRINPPHLVPIRTLNIFAPTRLAKQCGLPVPPEDPLILETIAAGDEVAPLPTALVSLGDSVDKGVAVSWLQEVLPVLDPTTVWIPLVGGAVLIRTLHCVYSRVRLYRSLQVALPHAEWFFRKRVERRYWSDKQDPDKVGEIERAVAKFKADKNVVGQPESCWRRADYSAIGLALLNLGLLHSYSLVYTEPLSTAPFLWIPSLLQPDPLYILPLLNVGLCLAIQWVLKRDWASVRNQSPAPQKQGDHMIKFSKYIFNIAFFSGISYCVVKAVLAYSPDIAALYFVFWTASNITGLVITCSILPFDFVRGMFGIVPKEEFRYLLRHEIVPDHKIMKREKKRLYEKLEHEKLENEKLELQEKLEHEKLELEKLENEKLENEKLENEKLENEKLELEKLELSKENGKRAEPIG